MFSIASSKEQLRLETAWRKGLEVDDQQINPVDTVLFDGLEVFGAIATCQQTAMNFWMQGFDAAIQNFG